MSKVNQLGTEPRGSGDFEPRHDRPESERDIVFDILGVGGGVLIVTDARGRIVCVNKARQDVSGYPAAHLHGKFIWDLAPPANREATRGYFERILGEGSTAPGAEQRQAEEQARLRRASLERAVALAHELSQPLEAIATYAQAAVLQLRKTPFDSDKAIDSLEKIATQVQSAAEILREVREPP